MSIGGWECTIGEAQSVPSNVGEQERLHISEMLHLPTSGVITANIGGSSVANSMPAISISFPFSGARPTLLYLAGGLPVDVLRDVLRRFGAVEGCLQRYVLHPAPGTTGDPEVSPHITTLHFTTLQGVISRCGAVA